MGAVEREATAVIAHRFICLKNEDTPGGEAGVAVQQRQLTTTGFKRKRGNNYLSFGPF